MKIFVFLIFFPIFVFSQRYNPIDTTYIFTYKELLKLQNKIEINKQLQEHLEKEIDLLEILNENYNLKLSKLEIKDSLYREELLIYREMDYLLRDKINKSNDIINNYRYLLLSTEEKVRFEQKNVKNEVMWKNVYKYGYPAIALIITIIILKS